MKMKTIDKKKVTITFKLPITSNPNEGLVYIFSVDDEANTKSIWTYLDAKAKKENGEAADVDTASVYCKIVNAKSFEEIPILKYAETKKDETDWRQCNLRVLMFMMKKDFARFNDTLYRIDDLVYTGGFLYLNCEEAEWMRKEEQ